MSKWSSKINLKNYSDALEHLTAFNNIIRETDFEYYCRKKATIKDISFSEVKNYFVGIRINESNRLYILKQTGRISLVTETIVQADRLVSLHRLFKNNEYANLKYYSDDKNWYIYQNKNRRIYFKKDIGTVFMHKTEYKINNLWLSKKQFKLLK